MAHENESPPPVQLSDDFQTAGWIFALSGNNYQALVDGYEEALAFDPASPLTAFLEAWIQIERGKQSLAELLA